MKFRPYEGFLPLIVDKSWDNSLHSFRISWLLAWLSTKALSEREYQRLPKEVGKVNATALPLLWRRRTSS